MTNDAPPLLDTAPPTPDINGTLPHPDFPDVAVQFVTVTPELATQWLERNIDRQRRFNDLTAVRYGGDMVAGDWLFTGDAIRFNADGRLIDGQHRLTAIKSSQTAQVMLVITGLDTDAMDAIDGGRKRTYIDQLYRSEIPNPTTVAGIVRRLWYWTNGNYGMRGMPRIANNPLANVAPSVQMLNKTWDIMMKQGIDPVAVTRWAMTANRHLSGPSAPVWGLIYIVLTQINIDLRERFFFELLEGVFESEDTDWPTRVLSRRLQAVKNKVAVSHEDFEWLHLIFQAFNAWSIGQRISQLKLPARPVRWHTLVMPVGYVERESDQQGDDQR